MMKKSEKYITCKVPFWVRNSNGDIQFSYDFKTYTDNRLTCYLGWQHRLNRISPISISLLFFLAEKMNADNEVFHNIDWIKRYNKFRVHCGIKPCSEAAIKKGYKELKNNNFLISKPSKGTYIVNPRYFYKGKPLRRKHFINSLLHHLAKEEWADTNLCDALGINYES